MLQETESNNEVRAFPKMGMTNFSGFKDDVSLGKSNLSRKNIGAEEGGHVNTGVWEVDV
jgi:hypothetical protein